MRGGPDKGGAGSAAERSARKGRNDDDKASFGRAWRRRAGAAALPAAAQEFVYGSWIPEQEYTNRVALPKAFEEIAAASDVNWRLVPGGQLVNPVDTWDGVESGLVQGGMGIPQYVPSVVPVLNTLYQTVLPGDETVAATGAVLETVMLDCPACLDELRDLNMLVLAGWDTSPYMLGCTREVNSVADMQGLKVRAAGGTVRLMEAAGAVPVAATLVEAINLLQTGAIDCVFGTAGWYRSFGYADFVTHHTDFPMGMTGPAAGWIMNRDAWDQLTTSRRRCTCRRARWSRRCRRWASSSARRPRRWPGRSPRRA